MQSYVEGAADSKGGRARSWTTEREIQVAFEPLRGQEIITAQAVEANVDFKVVLRYLAGLTTTKRLVYGSRTFNIVCFLLQDEVRHRMELLVKEQPYEE